MFDRVVAALVAVVLMLFSATAALACSECADGSVRCLVSLELQAEEVLNTDLEAVIQDGAEYTGAVRYAIDLNDQYEALAQEAEAPYMASGAAGVTDSLTNGESNHSLVLTTNAIEATARSGRSIGVGA